MTKDNLANAVEETWTNHAQLMKDHTELIGNLQVQLSDLRSTVDYLYQRIDRVVTNTNERLETLGSRFQGREDWVQRVVKECTNSQHARLAGVETQVGDLLKRMDLVAHQLKVIIADKMADETTSQCPETIVFYVGTQSAKVHYCVRPAGHEEDHLASTKYFDGKTFNVTWSR